MKLTKDEVIKLKNKLLFEKIISVYMVSEFEQPIFYRRNLHKLTNWGDAVIPELICEMGGYGYRDEPGRDAQDNSEIKVTGINPATGKLKQYSSWVGLGITSAEGS